MARIRSININQAGLQRLVSDPRTPTYRQMNRIGRAVQSTAAQLAPVDTGRLRQSGDTDMRPGRGSLVARVGFSARHALWVHEGTGIYGPRRAPIVPRRAQVLAWRDRGGWRYARSVRGMRPRPFLRRATRLVTGKNPR
ncbi:MAG TPA: hypothetical protein VK053_23935 [Jiangellaceae bacterium]|nr:hypothetical protein [Jiangellaceae bacterium]